MKGLLPACFMPRGSPLPYTMIRANAGTTMVRIAVAMVESVLRIPHFGSIEVSPANSADANASTTHILSLPLVFLNLFYYSAYGAK